MHPAKAIGQNEIPFGRDTRVVPSNSVLDRGLVPHGKGRFGVGSLEPSVCSNAAYCHITLTLVVVVILSVISFCSSYL